MQRLSEMFNVNHFIVSQVNPHVVPFLSKEDAILPSDPAAAATLTPSAPSWVHAATQFAKSEALHRLTTLADLGVLPNTLTKAASVLAQKYSGHITILPAIAYPDFPRMLSNPTPQFMRDAMLRGERAAWPKLSRVRNHCALELALDETAHAFRARSVFGAGDPPRALVSRSRSDAAAVAAGRVKISPALATDESAVIIDGRTSPTSARRRTGSQSHGPEPRALDPARRARRADHQKTRSVPLDVSPQQPAFFLGGEGHPDEAALPWSPSLASTTTAVASPLAADARTPAAAGFAPALRSAPATPTVPQSATRAAHGAERKARRPHPHPPPSPVARRPPTPPPAAPPAVAPLTTTAPPTPADGRRAAKTFSGLGLEIDVRGRDGVRVRTKRSARKQ